MTISEAAAMSVTEPSQVGEARRVAARLGERAGLSETEVGKASIIASELANNLSKYATAGSMRMQSLSSADEACFEMLSVDGGPGMSSVGRCMQDGFSTGGTPGNGLGAVKRLSDEFDIFSTVPGGTLIFSRIWASKKPGGRTTSLRGPGFQWGTAGAPCPGEAVSGDGWAVRRDDDVLTLAMFDGLGHGPQAAEASSRGTEAFQLAAFPNPSSFLSRANAQLSGTRGAAAAGARLDLRSGQLLYSGVGNIAGTLVGPAGSKGLFTHNGIVGAGARMPKVKDFEYSGATGSVIVMHSDGLLSRWSLNTYPGLVTRHPALIAGMLFRDFVRGKDDVTVLVAATERRP